VVARDADGLYEAGSCSGAGIPVRVFAVQMNIHLEEVVVRDSR